MEDTLRAMTHDTIINHVVVLILVLMEDTLRVVAQLRDDERASCLNPCFNGRYSQRWLLRFNGKEIPVLILVLMEDTLRVKTEQVDGERIKVLILVLMEDTLREQRLMFLYIPVFGVCSNF